MNIRAAPEGYSRTVAEPGELGSNRGSRRGNRMRRSASVTIAATVSLLGSLMSLGLGLVSAVAVLIARKSNPDLNEPLVISGIWIAILVLVVGAIWGIVTSRGLLRLRFWARISILVFSVLLAITGLEGTVAFPFVTARTAVGGFLDGKFGMAWFYAILTAIGIWWFVLFTRFSVRQQFAPSRRDLSGAQAPAFERPAAKAASAGL